MKNTINKPVTVTAFRFRKNQELYPTRAEIDGKTIYFADDSLTCRIQTGERISRILTLTDNGGKKEFRLRQDGRGGMWTLLSTSTS